MATLSRTRGSYSVFRSSLFQVPERSISRHDAPFQAIKRSGIQRATSVEHRAAACYTYILETLRGMKETYLGKPPRKISAEEARVGLLWRRGIWMNTLPLKRATLQTEKLSALRFPLRLLLMGSRLRIASPLRNNILKRSLTKPDISAALASSFWLNTLFIFHVVYLNFLRLRCK